jgi:glycine cleavage system aminomethyltransferase T
MLSDTVAHYGSAAAEIAVCSKAVGLAERSDLCLLDVSGAATLLEHALAPAISDAVPAAGEARCVADTWCCRIEPDRALVAGAAGAVDRWRHVVSRVAATTGTAVKADVLPEGEAVSIVGPKAPALMERSTLPAGLTPGGVAGGQVAGAQVWVVCEDELRYLLLFPQGCPVEALEAIGESGRPLGLARVGHEALSHMRAARRTND